MGFLRIADMNATKRVTHESGDWIDLRANLSKRDLNNILTSLPQEILDDKVTFQTTVESAKALFGALVVGWSLDIPADVEGYLSLDGEAATWVDGVVMEHFNSIQLGKDESGNAMNSASGSRKGTA